MNKFFSKKVIEKFPRVINEALVNNSLQVAGIDMLITHQVNLRIAQMNLEAAESASGKSLWQHRTIWQYHCSN